MTFFCTPGLRYYLNRWTNMTWPTVGTWLLTVKWMTQVDSAAYYSYPFLLRLTGAGIFMDFSRANGVAAGRFFAAGAAGAAAAVVWSDID